MNELQQIENKIKESEILSRELDIDSSDRRKLNDTVISYTENFLENLEADKTFRENHDQAFNSSEWSLDDRADIHEITSLIHREMDGIGLNPASGGHLGYIPGGGIYPAALGDFIAAVTNHYSTVHYAGPAAVELENYLIRWMGQQLGFSDNATGNLTSGGSIANLQSIIVARDFHNVMDGNPADFCIFMSSQSHHSLGKAIRIAGLKNCPVRIVDVDKHYRLNVNHLQDLIEDDLAQGKRPFLCITNLGSTDTGAVDPIEEIAGICREHNIWLHVDAAYGGFFKLVEEDLPVSLNGLHLVDSITIDPHKGLFLPYGTGACLFKNVDDLWYSYHEEAGYMQDAAHQDKISSADISIELSRHFRGLRMWLPLKLLGIERFKASLREKIWLCRYFYYKIQEMGFEVGPYPDLTVMIYRYPHENPNEFNQRLIDLLHKDGDVFISSTTLDGEIWLRLAVLSFRTHKETIDRCLNMIEKSLQSMQ